jgi:transposase
VNIIQNQPSVDGRRCRRLQSDDLKANAVASCMQPGVSMAAVAMANGVNANLLRRWVRQAESGDSATRPDAPVAADSAVRAAMSCFVPMHLPAKSTGPYIRIELRRGATS